MIISVTFSTLEEYLTLDKELQLLLRYAAFCLLNLDGHIKGKEQLVSLKQTYEMQ